MNKCKINNDNWDDLGVIFKIHSYSTRIDSSAVMMRLEHPDGTITDRTVPLNQIEWIR
jgi:hypothetical protein